MIEASHVPDRKILNRLLSLVRKMSSLVKLRGLGQVYEAITLIYLTMTSILSPSGKLKSKVSPSKSFPSFHLSWSES